VRAAALLAAALLAAAACAPAQAQQTFKCRDASGRITYVDRDCESHGLVTIGPVQDRTTVVPSDPYAQAGGEQDGAGACKPDARQFCREVKPGSGRMMDCLIDHQQQISEPCYQFLKAKLQQGK